MITTVFQKFLRTICLTHEKRSSNDWSQLIVRQEMDQKSSMAFSSHPELLACDVTCLTTTRHMTDSWQNERKLRYMPMIDLVQFSNSISQRSWHFLCNVCYDPNKVLLNVRHGFILGGCSSSVSIRHFCHLHKSKLKVFSNISAKENSNWIIFEKIDKCNRRRDVVIIGEALFTE